jgi:hypothetical protein
MFTAPGAGHQPEARRELRECRNACTERLQACLREQYKRSAKRTEGLAADQLTSSSTDASALVCDWDRCCAAATRMRPPCEASGDACIARPAWE